LSLDIVTAAASSGASSVLHVITDMDVGGAELALKRLILADPLVGARHSVISLRDVGPVGRELQAAGVTVHALHMTAAATSALAFVRLVRLIARLKPAVIQTWLYHADLFGGLAARCAGRREILWGVRSTALGNEASRLTVAAVKACALLSSRVPRVIVCCAETARVAHIGWGYCAGRMRVISNGFSLPDLSHARQWRSAMRAELGLSDACLVIGMVARFDPLKNYRGFVESAGTVARAHDEARFMLVGPGVNRSNDRLVQWIDDTGFADRFILLGERRDVERCFAAMDVFCLSSIHEAFPNVVAEAMAMALPCVVTDAGDAARIVGDAGWVVPPRDSLQLAQALEVALSCGPAHRQRLGRTARQRIETDFSIAATRRQYEAAYVDAIGEPVH
jgi:glycosyltransferase involved in cell wall biosynthesis